jgi:hypothetical protein
MSVDMTRAALPSTVPPTPPSVRRAMACTPHAVPIAATGRVPHPARVERRPPAAIVVLSQLQIVALAVHANRDAADAGPRIEPRAQGPQRAVVRGHRAASEPDCCAEELAALAEHDYSIS